MKMTHLIVALFTVTLTGLMAEVADASLVAYWSFDSDLTDSTSNHDATAVNGASITNTAGEFKMGGGALSLDGIDDHATFSTATLADNGAFTFAAWVNSNHLTSPSAASGTTVLFGEGAPNSGNTNWVRISHNKASLKNPADGTTNFSIAAVDEFQEGVWEHVAIVRTASEDVTVYRNGEAITTGTFDGAISLDLIGVKNGGYFDGFLDELYIYDEALDSEAIAALVPEPSSCILLLSGLLALSFRRRGKK